nr:MAG: hypothetical protein [Apis mellifera filamentous virus]
MEGVRRRRRRVRGERPHTVRDISAELMRSMCEKISRLTYPRVHDETLPPNQSKTRANSLLCRKSKVGNFEALTNNEVDCTRKLAKKSPNNGGILLRSMVQVTSNSVVGCNTAEWKPKFV